MRVGDGISGRRGQRGAARLVCVALLLVVGCRAGGPLSATGPAGAWTAPDEQARRRVADLADRAQAARRDNQIELARKLLKEAVRFDPSDGAVQHLLGLVFFEQGELYNAAIHLDRASRLLSDRFEPSYNLGRVLEAGGQYEEAIRSYQRALGRRVDHLETIENLARARIRAGYQDEETLRLLSRCIGREKRPEWCHWLQGEAARLRARLGGAAASPSLSRAAVPQRHDPGRVDPGSTE